MLKAELKYLKNNRFMMLVVAVLCLVPAIYAVPFLGSLWDTYGKIDQLPVVVVNQDQPVTFQGKQVDVGDQLVDELKKSDDLDFKFKNKQQAQQALKKGDAYMVLKIPKDFSKNATSLMTDHPQQMALDFETSAGHSFIASKLSESATERLRGRVAQTVTQAYTKTMFKELKKGGKQLAKAADGNQKLANGANEAAKGSARLTDGLQNLANGTLAFNSGATQLNVGLQQYVAGVNQAQAGNQQLGQGLQAMQNQLPQLTNGVDQLSRGQQSLTSGLNQARDGQEKLNDGIQAYTGAVNQLAKGSQTLSTKLNQAQAKMDANRLSDQDLQEIEADLGRLSQTVKQSSGTTTQAKVQNVLKQIEATTQAAQTMENILAGQQAKTATAIDTVAKAQDLTPAQTQAIKQAVQQSQASDREAMQAQLGILQTNTKTLQTQISPMLEQLSDKQADLERLQKIAAHLPGKFQQVRGQAQALSEVPGAVNQLNSGLQQLNHQSAQLQAGSQELVAGQKQLASGSQRLNTGVHTLAAQVPTMQQGVGSLVAGNGQLQSGLNTLASKGNELTNGSAQLTQGANQLSQGANQLQSGSQQLQPALGKIRKGNQTLSDRLDKGVKKIDDIPANKKVYRQFAKPVKTNQTDEDHVPNNGTGMAPYMFSVGLFVGMLAINMMVNLVDPRTDIKARWRWIGSKVVILFVIATLMAIVMFYLSKWILGMTFDDDMATLGLLILIAWMDAAIVTALNFWFGRAGSFVTIVLLVAQLSLSAGTYPIQLSPAIYQKLHAFVPMTYTVDGLRQTMMIGGTPTHDIYVMLGITVVALVAMWLYYAMYHRRNFQSV
ncbi:putative membrane protein [Weissella uvarum]|uniref:YhgE/Pip domain-containing protein n=1 Tax=Weissella uvarum TaxID=1479233 RepID=UPI00195F824D|nr:YhgE/Pip domain-containing protein [Weissella uvarum]MBM7618061.1 putative membrane protein [Weissella uvarum]MCM0595082.1 YhgE/Pip domain-containing protein [Weissella uvarum]